MTPNDIQDLINYIDDKAQKYATELPDVNGKPTMDVVVKLNDIMELLTKYAADITSEEKETKAAPDYESMYNRCLDSLEEMRDQVRVLKDNNTYMHEKLVDREDLLGKYAAALNTVEVMTGNKFDFLQKG